MFGRVLIFLLQFCQIANPQSRDVGAVLVGQISLYIILGVVSIECNNPGNIVIGSSIDTVDGRLNTEQTHALKCLDGRSVFNSELSLLSVQLQSFFEGQRKMYLPTPFHAMGAAAAEEFVHEIAGKTPRDSFDVEKDARDEVLGGLIAGETDYVWR